MPTMSTTYAHGDHLNGNIFSYIFLLRTQKF